jgi:hypothetical protein
MRPQLPTESNQRCSLSGLASDLVRDFESGRRNIEAETFMELAGVPEAEWSGSACDTPELTQIGLPVFSYGRCPAGPVCLDEQEPSARTDTLHLPDR